MKKTTILTITLIMAIVLFSALTFAEASDSTVLSISLVNQDPDPASSGDTVEVRIGIENRGGDAAENIMVELVPEYPFSLVAGESAVKEAGTIAAYQYDDNMKIVKFNVRVDKDATAGAYELKVKQYTKGQESVSSVKSLSLDIESQESAEVIYIDQVEIIPGKITPLKFTINNVGSSPLRELSFKWENGDDIILPVGSDNTRYIKYIDVGESAELEFKVIASATADPDLYKLDLSLTYSDPVTGTEKEIATKAGVYVGGATDFDAAFSGVSSGEASFSISNIGSVAASSVTVKIPEQQGWKVTGSNSVIIGNLNEGDYTIASFNLQQAQSRTAVARTNPSSETLEPTESETQVVRGTTQQTIPSTDSSSITLEIIYTDSRGNRNTITKDVPIDSSQFRSSSIVSADGSTSTATMTRPGARTTSSTGFWSSTKIIILIVILGVVSYVFYRRYKKEKIIDPGFKVNDLFSKKKGKR